MRRLPLLAVLLLGACTGHADDSPRPEPHWHEASLPAPPGAPGRIVVRDAVRCGERWYVVGGVFLDQPTSDQDSRPAAWRSSDGSTWTALAVEADTFWGQRAILTSAACAHGTVAAVGARSGGAHGNPRVTTFFEDAAGLHDVAAPYTQYGGEQATNVGPIAAKPGGWLITGNRVSGPAVWTSPDARAFTLHEGVPGLADDSALAALAQDAAWDRDEWVVVGGGNAPDDALDRQPQAWTSPDGATWTRETVPGSRSFDDVERVAETPDGLLGVGLRGNAFGAWQRLNGTWSRAGTFGRIPSDASRSPFVASLATRGGAVWATTSDGARYALWRGTTAGSSWTRAETPATPPGTAGEHVLSVAADAAGVLLLSDDGDGGRVWTAE
ncbi:hypothetical protein [Nocardioides sp. CER19]|uniref:hypothetical protein n=1 Tax=Nocardioides sp. CER19 TaxID=3038538 RepID=UPI00244AEA49|nr:hypothetical protein [Nocardioides sp. CER19]MDH2413014.1 hypothetical protein [Nocardioides sp. CER19]